MRHKKGKTYVVIKYYDSTDNTLERMPVPFCKEEYDRYLKRQFPIKSEYDILYYLDEDGFEHREGNLPAVESLESDGFVGYFIHGRLHRTNGVACYNKNIPSEDDQYYLNGVKYTKEEWERKTSRSIIFSRKNYSTMKKILYIPELFQNVYYENKKHFISLIQKM